MSKAKRLIGLTGYAQHGKDTVGARLVEKHGYTRLSFADGVREAVLTLNPIVEQSGSLFTNRLSDVVERETWEGAKQRTEVRRLLQVMGTEVARDLFGPDVWVDIVRRKLEDTYGPVVITDVRFPNEARYVARYGELWRVDRPLFNNGLGTDHPSEAHISSLVVDHAVANSGTLEDLYAAVDALAGGTL